MPIRIFVTPSPIAASQYQPHLSYTWNPKDYQTIVDLEEQSNVHEIYYNRIQGSQSPRRGTRSTTTRFWIVSSNTAFLCEWIVAQVHSLFLVNSICIWPICLALSNFRYISPLLSSSSRDSEKSYFKSAPPQGIPQSHPRVFSNNNWTI